MSQLSASRWEPSDILNIITDSNDISCAGITQRGLACGWRLDGEYKEQARTLLFRMSQKSPRQALSDLPQLARLCLCQKNHQSQAARVVAKWTSLVETYDSGRGRTDTHHPQGSGSSSDNSSSSSSNSNNQPSPTRATSTSIDMIISEMKALSIRQEELQRALQDLLPERENRSSNSGSVQASSSQSTPRSVSQTHLDTLTSRAQQSPTHGLSSRRSSPLSRDGWRSYLRRQTRQD
jgi:hypothetical protein